MLPLSISAAEPLKTDKTTYTEGEDILITAVGEAKDWVGIYKKGEAIGNLGGGGVSSIRWYYVANDGNVSGQSKSIFDSEYVERTDLADLPAGEYTVYLLKNDGYEIISQVDITVAAREDASTPEKPAEKTLSTDKTEYVVGEPILTTAIGEGLDWVGLYLRTDTLETDQSIRWYYVAKDGNTSGNEKNIRTAEGTNSSRAAYANVPAGEYTVYLCANDKWDVIAKVDITVKDDPSVSTAPAAPASVKYDLTKPFPGAADGTLNITAGEGALPESYKAYWANEDGALKDYTAFAPIECKGETTEYRMVANTLIPTDADRILVYAVRGNKLSDTAATVLLPEGCNDYDFGTPLYEMQVLSDIHINASQSHIHNQHFAMALEDIKKLSPNSIGIFVNGDIADHGEEAEYRSFQQLIENAGEGLPNVYCSIGNHDLASGPYQDKLDLFLQYTEPATDSVYFDQWIDGVHFIYLGSEATGLNAQLSREQLNWFKNALAENRDESRPIYVFLHQGLIDTVAGTFAYQKWHGINQSKDFAKILKAYPEVILFSGHSHWEMDSPSSMKARDDELPTIFNTAAVAYLWNDNAMATNVGVEGSQGYYLYAYEDKILVLGRDFVNGNWIASAQYVVDYPQTIGDTENEVIEDETVETPTTPSDNAQSAEAPANDYTGMIIGIAAAVAVVAGIAVTAISLKKRNK
ncbi:MAG: metallophosphoesterase [Clostridia bacterium]|nr:metallophosphoesterase [Clostridia bacterium]